MPLEKCPDDNSIRILNSVSCYFIQNRYKILPRLGHCHFRLVTPY